MKNVLVTGANGQLAMCIKDIGTNYSLNFIYTDYQNLDICNLNQVQVFFRENKIDYCINCAAYTAVDQAETEPERAFEINATAVKNLALSCKEKDVVLIHISTDFVFDGKKSTPYLETDDPNPISVYGASKLQGEIEVQNILKEHFIIRTSWLYSEHGNNFMKTMLRLADSRDGISVVSDQIGTPTYAGDLARTIIKIISGNSDSYGLYHFSNEGIASWYDFAKTIFEEANRKTKVNPIKSINYLTKAKRPVYSVLDKAKIKNDLNVKIPYWKDSLKQIMKNNKF